MAARVARVPGAAGGDRLGGRGVGAHVRAALLLGHRHPEQHARLGGGVAQLRVVDAGEQRGLPFGGQLRAQAQRRNHGVGHGQRAPVPGLDLRDQHEPGGPLDVRALPGVGPRRGVQSVGHRVLHDAVVGGVELDLVDAVAPPVVRVVHGRAGVGELGVVLVLRGADVAADLVEPLDPRVRGEGRHRVLQRRVEGELVHVDPRRSLVEDLVGGMVSGRRHGPS